MVFNMLSVYNHTQVSSQLSTRKPVVLSQHQVVGTYTNPTIPKCHNATVRQQCVPYAHLPCL